MRVLQILNSSFHKLFPLYVVIFIGFVGYALMITIFTPMILHPQHSIMTSPYHHKTLLLGVLLSLYPLGQFFGCSMLGSLSDHYGRKKVLMISLVITSLCYLLIAYAVYSHFIALLMVVLFIAGLSEGNIAIAQSSIADLVSADKRSQYFGYIYVSVSAAYIIGPLLGGKLADPSLISWFSNAVPFVVVCIFLVITLFWITLTWHDSLRPQNLNKDQQKVNYFEALTNLKNIFIDNKMRYLFLVNFLIYLALFGFFRSYPMYLVSHFHMNVSQESEFIAWVSVPIIIANLGLTSFLAKRFSAKIITTTTAVFTGVFLILILIPASPHALWITLFLGGLSVALCVPASCSMISQMTSSQDQGKVMGNNQSIQVGSEALSGIMAGILAGIMVGLPLICLAVISIVAGIMLFFKRLPA